MQVFANYYIIGKACAYLVNQQKCFHIHVILLIVAQCIEWFSGVDPGFDPGGPDHDRPKLPMVHSSIMQAKRALFSVGSGAHLRALEALGYFITKYAFSPFGVPFYTIFEIIKY